MLQGPYHDIIIKSTSYIQNYLSFYSTKEDTLMFIIAFLFVYLMCLHLYVAEILLPLPWSIRMKIAFGAAKGLAFLHEAEKTVIYRCFKTSNILLDQVSTLKYVN